MLFRSPAFWVVGPAFWVVGPAFWVVGENAPLRELEPLSNMILEHFDSLVRHYYGRYSLQCLIHCHRAEVQTLLAKDLPDFCEHRASCCVIEDVLRTGADVAFVDAVDEAVSQSSGNASRYLRRLLIRRRRARESEV